MLKRFALGLVKGLVVGGVIGAAVHFGLGMPVLAGLGGYLVAMAAGASAGVFTGKPLWKEKVPVEAGLKALAGLGVGALAYWAATKYGGFELPAALTSALSLPADAPADVAWTSLPLLAAPAVAATYGALIELDNTDDDEEEGGSSNKGVRARVAVEEEELAYAEEESAREMKR